MDFAGGAGLQESKPPITTTPSGSSSNSSFISPDITLIILLILSIIAFFIFIIYKIHKQTNTNSEFTEDNETKDNDMPKCKICGKETNGYKYCIDCFQKIQQGETEKCKLCGEHYIKGSICKCTKMDENTYQNMQQHANQNANYEKIQTNNKKSCSPFAIGCLTTLIIIIVIICSIFAPIASEVNKAEKAPTLSTSSQESFLDINKIVINVKCHADYEEVKVKIQLYDKQNNVIKTEYLIGNNYENGKTYSLTYFMSTYELLKTEKYSYSLVDYELD